MNGAGRTFPAKVTRSAVCGDCPLTQFATVDQLLFPPPPFQTSDAPRTVSGRVSVLVLLALSVMVTIKL